MKMRSNVVHGENRAHSPPVFVIGARLAQEHTLPQIANLRRSSWCSSLRPSSASGSDRTFGFTKARWRKLAISAALSALSNRQAG